MTLGIILSLGNTLYFKKKLNILFDFVPSILLMLSIFGYLCVLIILKWAIDWKNDRPEIHDPPYDYYTITGN